MKMIFRWFNENDDSVSLKDIRQIPGITGVAGFLGDIPAGEVWPVEQIMEYKEKITRHGLELEVIESVNIHEDIKLGAATRDKYIENYIQTIKNLSECGIKVICYNFMPVFDWLRTDLAYVTEDGSTVMFYDHEKVIGKDPAELVESTSKSANGFSLPGWEPERLKELKTILEQYKGMSKDTLRANFKYFLDAIIPVCEKYDVKMGVHPDDPAWDIFGIPRIAHSKEDFEKILALYDSPYNTLTLCTGSLGSNPENDLPDIIRCFGSKNRISFAHIRNIKFFGDKKFMESSHLSSDGSLDMYEIVKAFYDSGFDGYIRPDHGRTIWGEKCRPGYGLYDRALGLTYLNGLWEAISKGIGRR